VILAALHDLALAGRAPTLAAAYAAADGDAAAGAAIDTLLRMTDSVVAIAVRRQTRANETGRCAVLYPAIAEAAHRTGANAVGLIDVGCSAGLNLNVDRVGITYSNGQSLGDPSSPVQLSSSIVGDRPIPTQALPEVVARVGVDLDPVDVTNADDARWLRACLWPDQPEQVARLEAEMALAATAPPLLLRGDAVEVMPDAFARVPADALPVVTTTWALSHFPLESRLRFLHRLDEAAWRCSTGRLCVPRPSAAAGRRAACWPGWQTPRYPPGPVSRRRTSMRQRRKPSRRPGGSLRHAGTFFRSAGRAREEQPLRPWPRVRRAES